MGVEISIFLLILNGPYNSAALYCPAFDERKQAYSLCSIFESKCGIFTVSENVGRRFK